MLPRKKKSDMRPGDVCVFKGIETSSGLESAWVAAHAGTDEKSQIPDAFIHADELWVRGALDEIAYAIGFCVAYKTLSPKLTESQQSFKYLLEFETDFDFSVKFRDKLYADTEFSIGINDVKELDELEFLGPFGAPANGVYNCIWDGIQAIRSNPDEVFSNLGGNRGVAWHPIPQVDAHE